MLKFERSKTFRFTINEYAALPMRISGNSIKNRLGYAYRRTITTTLAHCVFKDAAGKFHMVQGFDKVPAALPEGTVVYVINHAGYLDIVIQVYHADGGL